MWYKLKFMVKKTFNTNSRYNYRTFKKGKVYEVRRKTTPSTVEKACIEDKDYIKLISMKRLKR